ncbi:uncharacterized protein EV420DRAFT_219468 [Desarmillaria tabescens]|uniref:Uncharacterized protein n=1 Tax=Armillaria tabescens TaxID=1929756 RepID=A0AA39N7S2_ARMTA|nr:uncharacterized protein EV420DRAFT_219468 [Desarmillaria tabescens]KAK0460592.1 hypothetical protein EV420DRAFT_219468 [Desarmillaria tabescens]
MLRYVQSWPISIVPTISSCSMSTSGALSLLTSNNVSVPAVNITTSLPAPFTVLPFDVCANVQCDDPELTFERIRSIQHLARFGRPMWHTMLAAGALEQWIIFLARTKLTHQDCTEIPKFGIHMGEPATVTSGSRLKGKLDVFKMALVEIRVMIEYEPRREESRWLQEEMVRAHMWVMFSAPAHGEYTTSEYLSEAILAEAAVISVYEERVDMVEVVHRLLKTISSMTVNGPTCREAYSYEGLGCGNTSTATGQETSYDAGLALS